MISLYDSWTMKDVNKLETILESYDYLMSPEYKHPDVRDQLKIEKYKNQKNEGGTKMRGVQLEELQNTYKTSKKEKSIEYMEVKRAEKSLDIKVEGAAKVKALQVASAKELLNTGKLLESNSKDNRYITVANELLKKTGMINRIHLVRADIEKINDNFDFIINKDFSTGLKVVIEQENKLKAENVVLEQKIAVFQKLNNEKVLNSFIDKYEANKKELLELEKKRPNDKVQNFLNEDKCLDNKKIISTYNKMVNDLKEKMEEFNIDFRLIENSTFKDISNSMQEVKLEYSVQMNAKLYSDEYSLEVAEFVNEFVKQKDMFMEEIVNDSESYHHIIDSEDLGETLIKGQHIEDNFENGVHIRSWLTDEKDKEIFIYFDDIKKVFKSKFGDDNRGIMTCFDILKKYSDECTDNGIVIDYYSNKEQINAELTANFKPLQVKRIISEINNISNMMDYEKIDPVSRLEKSLVEEVKKFECKENSYIGYLYSIPEAYLSTKAKDDIRHEINNYVYLREI